MSAAAGRGGPNRNQGRRGLSETEPTVTVSLRMTAPQRDLLRQLGGAEWVRRKLDEEREGHRGL